MKKYKDFITRYTQLQYLPQVPEIRLFLANDDNLHSYLRQEECDTTPYPYWAYAWAGGQALARYILDNPATVINKDVVDFGAGSGIVGIAAAKAGARSVTCIDVDFIAKQACELNARANSEDINITDTMINSQVFLAGDPWGRELNGSFNKEVNDYIETFKNVYLGYGIRKQNDFQSFNKVAQYKIDTFDFMEAGEIYRDVAILTNSK